MNNDSPKYFNICKGTGQECPLSSLLFIMIIEFLLIKVREDNSIKCLKYKGYEYEMRAFAADLVFILEDLLNFFAKDYTSDKRICEISKILFKSK